MSLLEVRNDLRNASKETKESANDGNEDLKLVENERDRRTLGGINMMRRADKKSSEKLRMSIFPFTFTSVVKLRITPLPLDH